MEENAGLQPLIKALIKKVTDIQIKSQQAKQDLLQAWKNLNSYLFDSHVIDQVKLCNDHLIQLNQAADMSLCKRLRLLGRSLETTTPLFSMLQ